MTQNIIKILNFKVSNNLPFFLIAGPCAIESRDHAIYHAEMIKKICEFNRRSEFILEILKNTIENGDEEQQRSDDRKPPGYGSVSRTPPGYSGSVGFIIFFF